MSERRLKTMLQPRLGIKARTDSDDAVIRFAFDGDAVLFSDEAEKIYKAEGLEAFTESERAQRNQPLTGGPFKSFLSALHVLQQSLPRRPH